MHTQSLVSLLILILLGCSKTNDKVVKSIEEETNVKMVLKEKVHLLTDTTMVISSLSFNDNNIFVFNMAEGTIISYTYEGAKENITGGIGKGPNEYNVEFNAEAGTCSDKVFAFDWVNPRIHIYEADLSSYRIINLANLPYDVSCHENETLYVQYSNTNEIDEVDLNGGIRNTFRLEQSLADGLEKFRRIKEIDNRFYIAYMFDPTFKIIEHTYEGRKEIEYELADENLSVRSSTRVINVVDDQIHLFFNDVESGVKKGIVFDLFGDYLFSYKIPERINLYMFMDKNLLVAVENSSSTVKIYSYSYE